MHAPLPHTRRLPANGFSLVELMVVLFVMALLAGVVVLSLPPGTAALRGDAERFAARTSAARDEAIAGARPVALVVGAAGYYFEQRAGRGWRPLAGSGGDGGGIVAWGDGVAASLAASGPAGDKADAAQQRQRVVFDPVGLASSEAAVRLARGGQAVTVRIARDGSVRLDAG